MFSFSLQPLPETFLDLRIMERDMKCTLVFKCCVRFSCPILMKHDPSRQIYEKYSNMKLHKSTSSGGRVVPRRRTDGRRDITKLIASFHDFANTSKNLPSNSTCDTFNFSVKDSTWCVQVLRSPKEAFAAAMQSWRERCEKCVCLQGDYVEK